MDEPKPKDQKEKAEPETSNDASTPNKAAQDIEGTPTSQATAAPKAETKNQEPYHPPKILESIISWLNSYWHAGREKSSLADIFMVILTLGVAVAAFWSAYIFQGQLTVARQTMDVQTRPWIADQKIEIRDTVFLTYPDNPIQQRTQINIEIAIPVKNVGFSPALNVHTGVFVTMTKEMAAPAMMDTLMQSACGTDSMYRGIGGVLFPNGPETVQEWPVDTGVPFIEVNEVRRAWAAVCMTYTGTDSDPKLHHTKVWMATFPINGQPKEIRRTAEPNVVYYSLPIVRWDVVRRAAD